MNHRTSTQFLVAWLCLAIGSLASATDDITIIVQPNVTIGAGFGELTPGPHELSITFQTNVTGGYVYAGATDSSGMTIWNYDNSGSTPTRPKLVCHGATEDMLGCIHASGYYTNYMNMMGSYTFGALVANAKFPCEPIREQCACNNYYQTGCPGTVEGGAEIILSPCSPTSTLAVTIHHGMAGTLTISTVGSGIRLLDLNDQPLGTIPISGSGITVVQFKVGLTSSTGVQTQLQTRFLNATGSLDSQDVYNVDVWTFGPANQALEL